MPPWLSSGCLKGREQEAIPKESSQVKEKSGAFIRGAAYYGGGDQDAE